MINLIEVNYNQTGQSKKTNHLGMREMQQMVYEKKDSQYLLVKAPPASGKSRALMFVALDKLLHQNIKKVIVAVPEKSIGGSFMDAKLSLDGFEADWVVNNEYNLCTIESTKSKSKIFKEFLQNDEKILICTHSTLRSAFETIDEKRFDNTLLAIDEFHHISASDASVLGNVLKSIISNSTAHIMAMTGSYFRGDAHPILLPEIEDKFEKVTYNYYQQLNGYEHLKSLGIGYHFYQGKYTNAISEVLDLTKKTIIHIPHINSRESTKDKHNEVGFILDVIGIFIDEDKNTGVMRIQTKEGKILKVADLVNDDPLERPKIQKYLREIKRADDMDIIIALGMAKEGFDWPYCESALTVGYRASLTEIIQIIGRTTRDSENKTHAQFTNLIAQPDATQQSVANATNDMLKAITASLLMEQVLAPNFNFKTKLPNDESKHKAGEFKIKGYKEPSSKRVKDIVEQDLADLKAKILSDASIEKTLGSNISAEVVNKQLIPKIIEEKYPNLSSEEREELRQYVVVDSVLSGVELDEKNNRIFIKGTKQFINIDDLSIDLIDKINPFQKAYEIMSKKLDEKVLKLIQDSIDASKSTVTQAEATFYWKDVNKFYKEHQREPNKNSNDEFERKLAEVLLYVKNFKKKTGFKMSIKDEFLKAISDDPFGLTIVKPKISTNKDESKIVIEKFMMILEFYEKNKKEPSKEASREERTLAIILESIRNDKNQKSVVKHLDIYDLLKDDFNLIDDSDIEKIESLDDDPFGLLGDESLDNDDIFILKNVSKTLEMPDYIATRKVCKDFFKYEDLFKNLQKDLQNKVRKIEEHKGERFIQKGLFFVLKGVVGYVAEVGKLQKQNNKINARLHCIFENGTESDMLLRSLSAELYKDGQVISFLNEEIEDKFSQITDEDETSGYIYILKSKSNDNQIRDIKNLYKIGYSTTKVDERLKNAKNEPTYLMGEVEQIAIYKCFNMNTSKLEQILHQFFGKSCLNIEIIGNDKKLHIPREWFIAPLEVIKQAIFMIVSGEIIYYKYDEKEEIIKVKEV